MIPDCRFCRALLHHHATLDDCESCRWYIEDWKNLTDQKRIDAKNERILEAYQKEKFAVIRNLM